MSTPKPEMRDICGDCRKVEIVSNMEMFEGDRYCHDCAKAIREDMAEFYKSSERS